LIEVREILGGDVDEIVADHSRIHLEVMDYGHVWMSIEDSDGKRIMVNFHSRRRGDGGLAIDINVEDD